MSNYYITPEQYDIAEKNGISKQNVTNRVREHGWSIEKAITEPLKRQFIDSTSQEIKDNLKKYGISNTTFRNRVKRYGWSYEKASTTPVMSPQEVAEFARQQRTRRITPEQYAIAKSNGICASTLNKRIYSSNWNIEKAITKKPMSRTECASSSFFRSEFRIGKRRFE